MQLAHKQILLSASLFLVSSCIEQGVSSQINVSAKRADGSPVPLAIVEVDGTKIGETNAFGTFSESMKLDPNTLHEIVVSHDDHSYYYSPHKETFRVNKDSDNSYEVTIPATMYLAPKPKKYIAASTPDAKASTLDRRPTPPISAPSPTTINSENAEVHLPIMGLNFYDLSSETFEASNNKEIHSDLIFTAHVVSGRAPISGAEVTWTTENGTTSNCITNERGRCVLRKDSKSTQTGSIIVRKHGYESSLKTIVVEQNQNIRFNLNPGSSMDVRFFVSSPWQDRPMTGVKFTYDKDQQNTSDAYGFAVIPTTGRDASNLRIQVTSPREPISIDLPSNLDEVLAVRIADQEFTKQQGLVIHDVHFANHENNPVAGEIVSKTIDSLISASRGTKTDQPPAKLAKSDKASISLIPLISSQNTGIELAVIAIDSQSGLWVTEKTSGLSLTNASIDAETKQLFDRVLERLPVYGVVKNVNGENFSIILDTSRIKLGEEIIIGKNDDHIKAKVTSARSDEITAKTSGNSIVKNAWKFIGARAVKPLKSPSPISSLMPKLTKLTPKRPELKAIDMARKHMLENNPADALRNLSAETTDTPKTLLLKDIESAQIFISSGDKSSALAKLYNALNIAYENQFSKAATFIDININRIKAELLPLIPNDKALNESLLELKSRNLQLTAQLTQLGEELPLAIATTEYTRLVLSQKTAELEQDSKTLELVKKEWGRFISEIHSSLLSTAEQASFSKASLTAQGGSNLESHSNTSKF